MAEREYLSNSKETDAERSSEDIRRDIAKGEENISNTVGQISDRFKEKLDWREYVKDFPYWAIGAAAGIGYLASGMFIKKTTPMERIMGYVADEVRDSIGGISGPGIVKVTLLNIATKAAASLIKNVVPTEAAQGIENKQDVVHHQPESGYVKNC